HCLGRLNSCCPPARHLIRLHSRDTPLHDLLGDCDTGLTPDLGLWETDPPLAEHGDLVRRETLMLPEVVREAATRILECRPVHDALRSRSMATVLVHSGVRPRGSMRPTI